MEIRCEGTAIVEHADTKKQYSISADELDWQQVSADERGMGIEIGHEAEVDHPDLGTLTWSLWEYPEGAQNNSETDVGPHKLVKDLEYSLEPSDD